MPSTAIESSTNSAAASSGARNPLAGDRLPQRLLDAADVGGDEHVQDHHRARVDDDLGGGDELRVEQQEQPGERRPGGRPARARSRRGCAARSPRSRRRARRSPRRRRRPQPCIESRAGARSAYTRSLDYLAVPKPVDRAQRLAELDAAELAPSSLLTGNEDLVTVVDELHRLEPVRSPSSRAIRPRTAATRRARGSFARCAPDREALPPDRSARGAASKSRPVEGVDPSRRTICSFGVDTRPVQQSRSFALPSQRGPLDRLRQQHLLGEDQVVAVVVRRSRTRGPS